MNMSSINYVQNFYSSQRVKRPGREADHSPPSSAEVKNGGAISPLLHLFIAWFKINYAQGQLYLYLPGSLLYGTR
jgi:hypothetical protein